MALVDLHALHKRKAECASLSVHPSRWLYAGRRGGGVFDIFFEGSEVVQVGDRIVTHFKELAEVGLNGKERKGVAHYFASETIAERYLRHVPTGAALECAVRDMLVLTVKDPRIEVQTPVGLIDILCSEAIIEVKRARNWKQALGQVLAYSNYYPSHSRVLHLFGRESDATKLSLAASVCQHYGVVLRFQPLLEIAGMHSRLGATVTANPSIERTSSSVLRTLPAAAHVKR
jgi:hypothetical protein